MLLDFSPSCGSILYLDWAKVASLEVCSLIANMNHVTKITETIGNTLRFVQEQRRESEDNSVSNGKCQKWRNESPNSEEKRRIFSSFDEYKFLICLICFSSAIVFCKVPIVYKDVFRRAFSLGKIGWSKPLNLVNYDFTSVPTAVFSATWRVFVELSWLFVPAIVGIVTTLITWRIIFLNSRIPGVDPPTPFSSRSKRDIQPSSVFGSYMFALFIGIAVFLTLLGLEIISF